VREEKSILEEQAEIEAALNQLPAFVAQLPDAWKPLVKLRHGKDRA
jgi:hypothetical protein